tara:strand:+ start:2618 stop:3259 length:642 start_codon:yes stop_codon:yes gene_type:complete
MKKMSNMSNEQNDKWSDEVKRQRQISDIQNSPLPKRGFDEFIKHDRTYLVSLREEMEHKIIKLDILNLKCNKVPKTREGTIENIDLLCEFSSLKREIFDLKAKLFSIANLVTDKENHFQYVFLPQYDKEIKESNEKFKDTLLKVRNICSDKELNDLHTEVLNKMRTELEAFDGLDKKERSDEERKLHLYKPLKRLLGAFNKTQSEIEDLEKYK